MFKNSHWCIVLCPAPLRHMGCWVPLWLRVVVVKPIMELEKTEENKQVKMPHGLFFKKRTRLSFFPLNKCSQIVAFMEEWILEVLPPPPPSPLTPLWPFPGAVNLSYLHCAGPITAFFFPHRFKCSAKIPGLLARGFLHANKTRKGLRVLSGARGFYTRTKIKSHPSPIFLSCLFSQILGEIVLMWGSKIISFTFQTTQSKADIWDVPKEHLLSI